MTDEEIGHRRINAGVFLHEAEKTMGKDGMKFNPHFVERHSDYQFVFENRFKDRIIDKVGETGWAIWFIQMSQENVSWLVDIYADDSNNFNPIMAVINKHIPKEFKVSFYYKGDINAYIQSQ